MNPYEPPQLIDEAVPKRQWGPAMLALFCGAMFGFSVLLATDLAIKGLVASAFVGFLIATFQGSVGVIGVAGACSVPQRPVTKC